METLLLLGLGAAVLWYMNKPKDTGAFPALRPAPTTTEPIPSEQPVYKIAPSLPEVMAEEAPEDYAPTTAEDMRLQSLATVEMDPVKWLGYYYTPLVNRDITQADYEQGIIDAGYREVVDRFHDIISTSPEARDIALYYRINYPERFTTPIPGE